MIEEHQSPAQQSSSLQPAAGNSWIIYALLSAIFAAATAILAKVGITHVESNLGTAIRTCIVLVMAWGIVCMRGKQNQLTSLNHRELLFIILSGLATGASWLCYYYAIQNGMVSIVVPLDKLSILVTIAFSGIVFHEKLSPKAALGLVLMSVATLAMALWL
ncbi:EamA family transporter [Olegusella massiliensis]|uniref:EamA family transporter n=1 Tax=Olegusella massiliensis TaxID=1776381 RepID=UPI003C6DDC03